MQINKSNVANKVFETREITRDDEIVLEIIAYNGNFPEVSIPALIDGKKVVGIGIRAFADNTSLTKLHFIKSNIEYIGHSAFEGCNNLVEFKAPKSLRRIGKWAFKGTGIAYISLNKDIEVIGEECFMNCMAANSVNFFNSSCVIGDRAFANDFRIKELKGFTNDIKSIGHQAFSPRLVGEDPLWDVIWHKQHIRLIV